MEGIYHDADLNDSTEPSSDSIPVHPSQGSALDFINHPINRELETEEKIRLYSQMLRIRRFEERSLRAYQQGHIGGFLHLYIGQEAVAVGAVSVMSEDCLIYTSPSPRDRQKSRMPSSA